MVEQTELARIAREELEAIIAWVRNSYCEEQPFAVEPTDEDVLEALRVAVKVGSVTLVTTDPA